MNILLKRENESSKVSPRRGFSVARAGAFAVKQRLDLESVDTAVRYIERYVEDLNTPDETTPNAELSVI